MNSTNARRKTSRHRRKSRHVKSSYFEALESRILLTATWKSSVTVGNWSDGSNWIGGSNPDGTPSATDDVRFASDATVNIDVNPTVASLTFSGVASVEFDFQNSAANQNITVTGDITMNQAAGGQTSFGFHPNGTNSATISATNFKVTGDATGWSNIYVHHGVKMSLSNDFDSGQELVGLYVNGELDATHDIKVMGKDTTNASTVKVRGVLKSADILDIGGNGAVNFTTSGSTSAATINIGHGSALSIPHGGSATSTGSINIGDFVGAAAALESGAGAKVDVAGTLTATSNGTYIRLQGGDATTVYVHDGGSIAAWNLFASNGAAGLTGSKLKVTGAGSRISALSSLEVGDGYSVGAIPLLATVYHSGELEIHDHAKVIVHNAAGTAGLVVRTEYDDDYNELTADSGVAGALETDTASIGASPPPLAANGIAQVVISGNGTTFIVHGAFAIGDGHAVVTGGFPAPPPRESTSINVAWGAEIDTRAVPVSAAKARFAVVYGLGKISAPGGVSTAGINADLMPGDYFLGHDDNGNAIPNEDSTDPFGTLTIDGDLDASPGFTLDSALGIDGSASQLAVTGTATFGGSLDGQFAAVALDPYSLEQADLTGMSQDDLDNLQWTLLTASATAGGFTGYSWGSPLSAAQAAELPSLPSGMHWHLDCVSSGSVMALVLTTADLPDPGNYIFTSDAFMLDGEGNIVPNPNSTDPFDGFPTNWQDIGSRGEGPGHYRFPCAQRTSKLRRAA